MRSVYKKGWQNSWTFKERKNRKIRKNIVFMLRSDPLSKGTVTVKGTRCNLGDVEGLQVPFKLILYGQERYLEVLKQEPLKLNEL